MAGHFNNIQKMITKNLQSDSLAAHFSSILPKNKKPSRQELRTLMSFKVLHHSNPISAMKTIRTDQLKLCTDEKIRILKNSKKSGTNLINKCSEVYSACRHQTKFHRFPSYNNGTDETSYNLVERVTSPLPNSIGRTSFDTTTTTIERGITW